MRLTAGIPQRQLSLETGVQCYFFALLIDAAPHQPTIGTVARMVRALPMKASELMAEAEQAVSHS